ncbi:MAG: sulfatase-like hydrolase/transferase [Planctomycetes bacterium]|nr:sulfatase-like hydrolase/transferase [Planctomycetota bacterium]MBL7188428.1 sulfatase-like hydrolase/transferase [Phycisphaerae bacterium]
MNRREFVKFVAAGAAALLFDHGQAGARSRAAGKPNIILIMADDLGYGDIGCYGSGKIKTPSIDALAKSGMKFTDYHSNCPVCSPTRAALLTGRYQQRSGIEGVVYAKGPTRQTGLAMEETTFAEVLEKRGYATALFGKWHLGYNVEFNPARQGFDEFRGYVSGNVDFHSHIDGAGFDDWWKNLEKVPEEGYTTDLITKHGVDFIERHKDEPFCLYLPHEAPHYPYQGRNDPPERLGGGKKGRKAKGPEITRAYREMVEVMDEGIGRIVETVRRLHLERKTFIFFCSDNGATKQGSNGALSGYKGSLWEGGHRVPAVACWPGRIRPGTTTDQTVLGMDLYATMVSIAGAKLPTGLKLDGVDLLGMLTENKKLPERALFWRYRKERAVRRGPWKLLVRDNKATLYNLDEDLGETNDLARAKPRMLKRLEDELAIWEQEVSAGVELRA